MLTFLIMAGGSGERFWPLSSKDKPKQFLSIFSDKPLIRKTYERVLPLVTPDRIFVSVNHHQVAGLKEILPELKEENIIIEPAHRDTAAAVGYGSLIINKYFPDAAIAVLPSDHLIQDEAAFRKVLLTAERNALKGRIVTIGVKPDYPETGYGYIQSDYTRMNHAVKVKRFREKPSLEKAMEYLAEGGYLWNAGVFVFQYRIIMRSFRHHAKKHYAIFQELETLVAKNEGAKTAEEVLPLFKQFEKISIDYAVMEKSTSVYVVPASFGWNDVGSYEAFDSLFPHDSRGNVTVNTNVYCVASNGNIVISDEPNTQVCLLGLSDRVIAVSKGKVLVCSKSRTQEIKKALLLMKNGGQ